MNEVEQRALNSSQEVKNQIHELEARIVQVLNLNDTKIFLDAAKAPTKGLRTEYNGSAK